MKIVYKNPCTKQMEDDLFLTEFNKTSPELQIWNLKNAEEASLINFLKEKSLQSINSFNCMILLHSPKNRDYLASIRELLSVIISSLDKPINFTEELDSDSWGRLLIGENLKGISYHRDLEGDCLLLIALEDSNDFPLSYWEVGLKLKKFFLDKKEFTSLVTFKKELSIDESIYFYKELLEDSSNKGIYCMKVPRYRKIGDSSLIPISNSFPEQDEFLSKIWKKSHSNFLFETLNALIFVKVPLYFENELLDLKRTLITKLCLGNQNYKEIVDSKNWGKITLSGMTVLLTYTEKTSDSIVYYIAYPGRDPQEFQDSFFETPFSTAKVLESLGTEEDLKSFIKNIEEVLVNAEIY